MNSIPRISLLLLVCAIACLRDRRETESTDRTPIYQDAGADPASEQLTTRAGSVVDSALPMEELIRRFRNGLPTVNGLEHGESTREALVRRFVEAVAKRDSASLGAIIITRPEYGYVYFPGSHLAKPPYELDPGYAWFHIRSESESGIRRTMTRYGGRSLEYAGHRCTTDPTREGPVTIWKDCVLKLRVDGNPSSEARLFASIIEHRGQLKFFSYANAL